MQSVLHIGAKRNPLVQNVLHSAVMPLVRTLGVACDSRFYGRAVSWLRAVKIFSAGACTRSRQELGFANISMGLLGLISIANRQWCIPAAVAGATFSDLAGFKYLQSKNRNRFQIVAMISDLFVSLALAVYLAATLATKAPWRSAPGRIDGPLQGPLLRTVLPE